MAKKPLKHPTTGPGHPQRAGLGEEHVLTPGGWRPKSRVHLIEHGHHVTGQAGRLKKIHTATGKVVHDFGAVAVKKTARPNLPANVFVPELKRKTKAPTGAVPTTNGWVIYSGWTNDSGQPITSFSTMDRSPVPKTSSGQTIFIFNGIQNSGFILQPVLQWGPSFAGGGNYWTIGNWYVDGQGGLALHSPLVQVNPGDDLLGIMTLTAQSGSQFSYLSSFAGYAGTNLQVNDIEELTWANETLEVYGVTQCSDYPNTDVTAMAAIEIRLGSGAEAAIDWQANNAVTDCGQQCKIVSNASPGGEVDLCYRPPRYHVVREATLITDFVLLWILRHGGEWPDWGDPYGQLMLASAVKQLANGLRDDAARQEIQRAASRIIAASAESVADATVVRSRG